MRIPINKDYLFSLNFADDQVVMAQDSYDLKFMVKRLYDEYRKWGLQVSLEKTEYLAINKGGKSCFISAELSISSPGRWTFLVIPNESYSLPICLCDLFF